jgi:hypothetical protein
MFGLIAMMDTRLAPSSSPHILLIINLHIPAVPSENKIFGAEEIHHWGRAKGQ